MPVAGLLVILAVLAAPQGGSVSLEAVLGRAADHVAALRQKATVTLARESSVQILRTYGSARNDLMASGTPLGEFGDPKSRKLQAEFAMAVPMGSPVWQAFRDVYEIDGRPLRAERDRLQNLLQVGERAGMDSARQLTVESLRHDLGTTPHDLHVPMFPLAFLDRAQQKGVAFEKKGEKTVDGLRVWVIAFKETAPPLATMTDGTPQPSRGEFYIDPLSGVVVRTHLVFDTSDANANARTPVGGGQVIGGRLLSAGRIGEVLRLTVDVSYRKDLTLDAWLPIEMKQMYDRRDEIVNVTATYSDYRVVAVKQ